MAVRQIASTGDHTLTYEAIAALHKVVSNMPGEVPRASCRPRSTTLYYRRLWLQRHYPPRPLACLPGIPARGYPVRSRRWPTAWVIDPYQLFFNGRGPVPGCLRCREAQIRMFRVNRIQRVGFLGVRMPHPWCPTTFASAIVTASASLSATPACASASPSGAPVHHRDPLAYLTADRRPT